MLDVTTASSSPRFGTLPLFGMNAAAIPIPQTDDYLVTFNAGMMRFCHAMTKLAIETVELNETLGGEKRIDASEPAYLRQLHRRPSLGHQLRVGVYGMLKGEDLFLSIDLSFEKGLIVEHLDQCIVMFVLGHEYARVLNADKSQAANARLLKSEMSVPIAVRSRAQELFADQLGMMLMARAMGWESQNNSGPGRFAGADAVCANSLCRI